MEEERVIERVDQRSKNAGLELGRRDTDKVKCVMCDHYADKNAESFSRITQALEKSDKKISHRFELLETRLHTYMTKWSMGIIVLVCSGVLGVGGAFGLWQLKSVHEELIRVNGSMSMLSKATAVIATKQEGIILRLEQITPEHKELMKHLERNGLVK